MIHLNQDFYNDLAQELITLIYDNESVEGVIEMRVMCSMGCEAEVIFAFNATNFSIDRGLESINYLVLGFQGGRRASTDFNSTILSSIIDE